MAPLKQVTIFCDGSSLGNGQASSRAAAVALLGYKKTGLQHWKAFGEYLGCATNQQAEIVAAAVGLEALREPCDVKLFTDSRYVVETMSGRFRRKTNLPWRKRPGSRGEQTQSSLAMDARPRRSRPSGSRGQRRAAHRRRGVGRRRDPGRCGGLSGRR